MERCEVTPATTQYLKRLGDQETDWVDSAACKGKPVEIWYPDRGDMATLARAVAICARCPVSSECLACAVETNQHLGIWGGLSGKQRRALRPVRSVS